MYKVRLAKESDLVKLATLDKIASLTPWTLDNYTSSLNNSQHTIYILENDNQIIGAIVLGLALDEGEILQFWIKVEYQKKGFGLILLQNGVEFLRKKQIVRIFLEVRSDNISAINLYEKVGFVNAGVRKDYYKVDGWTFDALVMLKHII